MFFIFKLIFGRTCYGTAILFLGHYRNFNNVSYPNEGKARLAKTCVDGQYNGG